jgi:hypothetical protein
MPSITSPKTRFNTPVSPYRVFEATEFRLDDIKFLKSFADVKINDVVLAIVSGGMRHYLSHHNELPDESMAVAIPLNMRTRRGMTDANNQIGSVFMDVYTNIADPLERLASIHRSSQDAKVFGENSPLVDVLTLAGVMPPVLTRPLINSYVNNELTRHLPLGISSVVSNVAGPPFPMYSAGAEMIRYYGLGLLTPGVGLFHLVFSSNGIVTLSIVGDRNSMPDPAFYRECIEKSFHELLAAAKASELAKSASSAADKPKVKTTSKVSSTAATSKSPAKSKAKSSAAVAKPVARKAKSVSAGSAGATKKTPAKVSKKADTPTPAVDKPAAAPSIQASSENSANVVAIKSQTSVK